MDLVTSEWLRKPRPRSCGSDETTVDPTTLQAGALTPAVIQSPWSEIADPQFTRKALERAWRQVKVEKWRGVHNFISSYTADNLYETGGNCST